jgi:hypothetical protein
MVRFNSLPDKGVVWSLKQNLKGTNVFLREDLSPESLAHRNALLPIVKKARATDMKCAIVGDILYLESKRYSKHDLHKLPPALSPVNVSTRSDNECLAFFGKSNPLSNFHGCSFSIGGVKYNSTEQFYQSKKADFVLDMSTKEKIMTSNIPAVQKRLGDSIKILDKEKWNDLAPELMYGGIMAKFSQNQDLKNFLLSTGDKHLIEASPRDTFWGSGLSLTNKDCLKADKHRGRNLLGKILESVRSQLAHSDEAMPPSNLPSSPMG